MIEDIGFVKGDKYSMRILEAAKSKATLKEISGRLHIPVRLAERTLKELQKRKLIKPEKDSFVITDKGFKILAQIFKQRM